MTARADKSNSPDLKSFGWQGIRLSVPSDWELVAIRGDCQTGYAALADETALRLEIGWYPAPGRFELSEFVSRHLEELRKNAKKQQRDVSVRRGLKLADLKEQDLECYEWAADTQGAGMVSQCKSCKRIVHLVVTGKPGESPRKLARSIFASLRDHQEDGGELWNFYDFEFSNPTDLPLRKYDLKTGCVRMLFGKGTRELEFVRVSLAGVLLASQPLSDWFKQFYGPALRHWRCRTSPATIKGHQGLRTEGRPWLVLNPGKLIGWTRETWIACWHCESSNRLFIVRHAAPPAGRAAFEEAVEGLKCCVNE